MTCEEAYGRVLRGESFTDKEIQKLDNLRGWNIAHEQAYRGWTTLDPDILSLKNGCGSTVLDIMLKKGWEPKTEEEKLIVFTVKAGA